MGHLRLNILTVASDNLQQNGAQLQGGEGLMALGKNCVGLGHLIDGVIFPQRKPEFCG